SRVTLVRRRAAHRVRTDAGASVAGVALGAGVAVVAARPVGLRRVRASAGLRVAGAGRGALGGGGTLECRPDAGARLAAVTLRAGVPVAAGAAVGLGRVRADASLWVARAGGVALVGSRALDRAPDAAAGLAAVSVGAGIAVVATGPVGLRRVRA